MFKSNKKKTLSKKWNNENNEISGEGQVNKENEIKWKSCEINQMKIRRRAHEMDRGKSRKHGWEEGLNEN